MLDPHLRHPVAGPGHGEAHVVRPGAERGGNPAHAVRGQQVVVVHAGHVIGLARLLQRPDLGPVGDGQVVPVEDDADAVHPVGRRELDLGVQVRQQLAQDLVPVRNRRDQDVPRGQVPEPAMAALGTHVSSLAFSGSRWVSVS